MVKLEYNKLDGRDTMQLSELLVYSEISIQCHDNPDPDTIAAGFVLYSYFEQFGKKVQLIYSGNRKITKPNIVMMVEVLKIPLEYKPNLERVSGLLITVDCQYGAGNVTYIEADAVAIIDHHIQETPIIARQNIRSELASSATLVWDMLCNEGFDVNQYAEISTALYYGLFTDSSGFTELRHALDKDMRDSLKYNPILIRKLKNSIITLKELEIAGMALIRSSYNEANKYVMVRAQECDPNILGVISDFALQVDCVNVVIVYNETVQGIKYSVRSCVKEIMANELATFLSQDIGNGGGHKDKAAGFISRNRYDLRYRDLNADEYFLRKLTTYYQSYEMIYDSDYVFPDLEMKLYKKLPMPMGCIELEGIVPHEAPFFIRSQKEDITCMDSVNQVLIVDLEGQITLMQQEDFEKKFDIQSQTYNIPLNYFPRIRMSQTDQFIYLKNYTKECIAKSEKRVWAKALNKAVKLFSHNEDEHYTLGQVGDYLVIYQGEKTNMHIINKEQFERTFEVIER